MHTSHSQDTLRMNFLSLFNILQHIIFPLLLQTINKFIQQVAKNACQENMGVVHSFVGHVFNHGSPDKELVYVKLLFSAEDQPYVKIHRSFSFCF